MAQTLQRTTPGGSDSAKAAKPKFRSDIQGLRALAVGVVVAYHTGLALPGGYVGVDMFFVISGFVITRQVLWEHATTGALDLKKFYLRRIRRIVPALTLMVVIVSLVSPVLGPVTGQGTARATAISATLINANNYLAGLFGSVHLTIVAGVVEGQPANYFDSRTELNPFLHTWSLSVEEQFYLVFPLLIAAAGYVGLRGGSSAARKSILATLTAVGIASFIATLIVIGVSEELAFFLAPLRAWEFVAGALLVAVEGRVRSSLGAAVFGMVGLLGILATVLLYSEETFFPGVAALLPVVATALLIQAGSMGNNPVSSLLSTPSAVYVGTVSYSWYLWHWPFIVFAMASGGGTTIALLIAAIGSLPVAGLSTKYFEDRIRHSPATPYQTLRLLLICVVLSIGAIQGSALISSQPVVDEDFAANFPHHETQGLNCGALPPVEDACVFDAVGETQGRVLLVGDSNAQQLIEGAVAGLNNEGYEVTAAYIIGCPFVTTTVFIGDDEFARCQNFVDEVISEATANPYDLIVFSNATELYLQNSSLSLEAADGTRVTEPTALAELFSASAINSFEQLSNTGSELVLIKSVPKLAEWNAAQCSSLAYRYLAESCSLSVPLDQTVAERQAGTAIEIAMAERANAEILSFDDVLCEDGTCSAFDGETWVWRDRGHISVAQSEALASQFTELVAG